MSGFGNCFFDLSSFEPRNALPITAPLNPRVAMYDNLGKGASLAAVQNLKLMLGC